jgi:hypothetical protein
MGILWHRFRWGVWAALSMLATALLVIFRGLVIRPKGDEKRVVLPEVPPTLKKKVEKVEEAALVSKVKAAAKSETQRETLNEIAKVPDGSERRKQLANLLKDL